MGNCKQLPIEWKLNGSGRQMEFNVRRISQLQYYSLHRAVDNGMNKLHINCRSSVDLLNVCSNKIHAVDS